MTLDAARKNRRLKLVEKFAAYVDDCLAENLDEDFTKDADFMRAALDVFLGLAEEDAVVAAHEEDENA